MPPLRIFISYTLRGDDVTCKLLRELKAKFSAFKSVSTYIDILDNINTEDPQAYVIEKLTESDCVLLIQSKNVDSSVWVKKELELAHKLNKLVINISLRTAKHIAYSSTEILNAMIQKTSRRTLKTRDPQNIISSL